MKNSTTTKFHMISNTNPNIRVFIEKKNRTWYKIEMFHPAFIRHRAKKIPHTSYKCDFGSSIVAFLRDQREDKNEYN